MKKKVNMSATTATPPVLSSYYIRAKDVHGQEKYYPIRVFEVDKEGKEHQLSLTIHQWKQHAALLEQSLSPFLGSGDAIPPTFEVDVDAKGLHLSSKGHDDIKRELPIPPGRSPEQISLIFRNIIYYNGSKEAKEPIYSAKAIPIPPLPDLMKEDGALQPIDPAKAPIGIKNEGGRACFSAFIQAFIIDNDDARAHLWAQRDKGPAAELGRFLHHYQEAQNRQEAALGINQVRSALARHEGRSLKYLEGTLDVTEAFDSLIEVISPIEQEESCKGYIHVEPEGEESLEDLVIASIQKTKLKDPSLPPKHILVRNANREGGTPFNSVAGTLTIAGDESVLTSFIQHIPGNGGHYIAYVKRGDNYYQCNDSHVTPIDEATFLEAAKTAYIARYSKV